MTKRSRSTAAVWILRIEDQPNGPRITVTSRSELVGPGVDLAQSYRTVADAAASITESAEQFVTRAGHRSDV